jgi:hypothetical protein
MQRLPKLAQPSRSRAKNKKNLVHVPSRAASGVPLPEMPSSVCTRVVLKFHSLRRSILVAGWNLGCGCHASGLLCLPPALRREETAYPKMRLFTGLFGVLDDSSSEFLGSASDVLFTAMFVVGYFHGPSGNKIISSLP